MFGKTKFLLLLTVVTLILSACATAPQGVVVATINPPEYDITSVAQTRGDAYIISIDDIQDPHGVINQNKKIAFYVRNALKDALLKTLTFNVQNRSAHPFALRIKPEIDIFRVTKEKRSGYSIKKGEATINFSLLSSSASLIGSTTEYAKVRDSKPAGAENRSDEDIMLELAKDICQNFVKKLVPTKSKEFREFAKGNSKVNIGVIAAMNKNWDGAIEVWEEVLKKDPNNAPALYNSGIAWEAKFGITYEAKSGASFKSIRFLRKALKKYKEAYKLDTGNSLYHKNYARLKKKLEASKSLDKLTEKISDDTVSGSD